MTLVTLDRRPYTTPWHELPDARRAALLARLEEIERNPQDIDWDSDSDGFDDIDTELSSFDFIEPFPPGTDFWLGVTPEGRAVLDAAAIAAATPSPQSRTTSTASRL